MTLVGWSSDCRRTWPSTVPSNGMNATVISSLDTRSDQFIPLIILWTWVVMSCWEVMSWPYIVAHRGQWHYNLIAWCIRCHNVTIEVSHDIYNQTVFSVNLHEEVTNTSTLKKLFLIYLSVNLWRNAKIFLFLFNS